MTFALVCYPHLEYLPQYFPPLKAFGPDPHEEDVTSLFESVILLYEWCREFMINFQLHWLFTQMQQIVLEEWLSLLCWQPLSPSHNSAGAQNLLPKHVNILRYNLQTWIAEDVREKRLKIKIKTLQSKGFDISVKQVPSRNSARFLPDNLLNPPGNSWGSG